MLLKDAPVHYTRLNLRPDTVHTVTNGCFQNFEPVFAMPKHGNAVSPFTTGRELFEDIARSILAAKRFILFTDWQMDFDVELTSRGDRDFNGRFSELLARKVAEGVEVKVLLYDSVEAAVYTHENHVRENLMMLNPRAAEFGRNGVPKRNPAGNLPVEVALQKPATGRTVENILFSHHQKSIVIDGTIAYIGGIDVTYGRWCDNNFDVVCDPEKHRINDAYNPGLPGGRFLSDEEKTWTTAFAGGGTPGTAQYGLPRPGFARPYSPVSTLKHRFLEVLQRGYTIQQLEDLIQLMQIDDQIRDHLLQKAREIRAVLIAIDRTLKRYSDAKGSAADKLADGKIVEGLTAWFRADGELAKAVLRKVLKGFEAMGEAMKDFLAAKAHEIKDWFDEEVADIRAHLVRLDEYRRSPALLVDDFKRLFSDVQGFIAGLSEESVLEEGCQPRLPWQDVHCRIEGPAVHDVFANFIRRWNVAVKENADNTALGLDRRTGLDHKLRPLDTKWLARWGSMQDIFGDLSKHGTAGKVTVQVVRSMAQQMLTLEAKHARLLPLTHLNGKSILDAQEGKTGQGYANNDAAGSRQMDGVLEAMLHAVNRAQAYLYIETQFFISHCGLSDKHEEPIAKNPLAEAIARRIAHHIGKGQSFHVYMVLPVHPEGNLLSGSVAKQQYWILQSLKRGRRSLIWMICEILVRRDKKLKPGEKPAESDVRACVDAGGWREYLTLLNLRSWGVTALFERDPEKHRRLDTKPPLGQFVITEQVYVHSKLLIVDDAIAIIGSANCNDRSLLGNGDTELAAVIVDNDIAVKDLGNGVPIPTRKFARELRIELWKKHLGLKVVESEYTLGDRRLRGEKAEYPETPYPHLGDELRKRGQPSARVSGVKLELPAHPSTWKAIQDIARSNAGVYEKVFQHTPRNSMAYFREVQNGWPRRPAKTVLAARFGNEVAKQVLEENGKSMPSKIDKHLDKMTKGQKLVTDFGSVPPQLKEAYMRNVANGQNNPYDGLHVEPRHLAAKVHNLEKASDDLRALVGFWVELPLDFGHKQRDVWLKGSLGAAAVAQVDDEDSESPKLASESGPGTAGSTG